MSRTKYGLSRHGTCCSVGKQDPGVGHEDVRLGRAEIVTEPKDRIAESICDIALELERGSARRSLAPEVMARIVRVPAALRVGVQRVTKREHPCDGVAIRP